MKCSHFLTVRLFVLSPSATFANMFKNSTNFFGMLSGGPSFGSNACDVRSQFHED